MNETMTRIHPCGRIGGRRHVNFRKRWQARPMM